MEPTVIDALHRGASQIAKAWEQMMLRSSPALDPEALRPTGQSLQDVVLVLAGGSAASPEQAVCLDRQQDLCRTIAALSLLRPAACEHLARSLGRGLLPCEIEEVSQAVDAIIRQVVQEDVAMRQADLQAVVDAQSKYMSFLSHDLRGGLNGVLLMIEVLRRDLSQQPQFASSLEDLDLMRRSVLETVGTMDRFLHAERFRLGKVQVRPAPIDLAVLAQEVTGQFAYQARDKGLELRVDLSGAGALVSDKSLIVLIVQALISNAIKYSRRGLIEVTATTAGLPRGIACRICVRDQGPGLAGERLEQLLGDVVMSGPATGLGLVIARQAAEALGGTLGAQSVLGEGSTFYLDLPAAQPRPA
jgi:signal transduction histidine kinase